MNPIFQKLLLNKSAMRPFLQWYNDRYKDLAVFQNDPFTKQLGVYLEYFETTYSMIVLVNTFGYSIQFSDNRKTPIVSENNMQYNHYKFAYNEPKSIIYGYQLAVEWLFENYDVPF